MGYCQVMLSAVRIQCRLQDVHTYGQLQNVHADNSLYEVHTVLRAVGYLVGLVGCGQQELSQGFCEDVQWILLTMN